MEQNNSNRMAWIVGVVIALVLGGLVVYALMNNREPEQSADTNEVTTTEQQDTNTTTPPEEEATEDATITFTDSGFSPNRLTVKVNTKVTVKNESGQQVQFSSDDHPTHTKQSELNLAVLASGESASFTPTRTGSWGFHNHLNESFTGVLEVTE